LSLASDCQGKERELVDYNLSRPALFFAFLAYFKPANITRMAAALQEALLVRRVELIKFWQSVTPQSSQKTTSVMEKLGFEYVIKVREYSESATAQSDLTYFLNLPGGLDVELPSKTTVFIAQSYFAITDAGAAKLHNSSLFLIAGTNYYVRVQPTLLGSRFLGIYKMDGDKKVHEGGSCTLYTPQFTIEEVRRYMILPITALGIEGEFVYRKDLVDRVKNAVAKNHGTEILKPLIEMICYTLYKVSMDDTENRLIGKWCLIDCSYILATLYGYKLLRPRELRLDGSNTDIFASA
jgi:hypothetical protein